MPNQTPFFQAFGPLLFGRPARAALARVSKLDSLQELYGIFGDLFPQRLLNPTKKGTNSRRRSLPAQVTFWAFVWQVLSPGSSCRETVRKVEAWWRLGQRGIRRGLTPSAYCQARARLDSQTLKLIHDSLAWNLERNTLGAEHWLEGRAVKIVDGTTCSMPDTAANQQDWPQSSWQKPGLGFPLLKLVGLFSLGSGALLQYATGNLHVHESQLFRRLWESLQKHDIILADRGFCSYAAIASLILRGVDSVMRLHQMRKADFRSGKALGKGERLVTWTKPAQRTSAWSAAEFAALPASLVLRMIRLEVAAPGFRTRRVILVTTLLDQELYPAEEIRSLYGQRWSVELHFHQLKTILHLDILRCQSPELINKELQLHLIVYNLIRALMQKAAHCHDVSLARISFKGTLDTVRQWNEVIHASSDQPRKQSLLISDMLRLIALDTIPHRPGRSEPRAKKRRPKNFQLLTRPRHQMGNLPHRNRPIQTIHNLP
jgi:Transposase DDE domain